MRQRKKENMHIYWRHSIPLHNIFFSIAGFWPYGCKSWDPWRDLDEGTHNKDHVTDEFQKKKIMWQIAHNSLRMFKPDGGNIYGRF
jgi:hypothetical protein